MCVSWMASEGYVGDPLLRDYSQEERVLILTALTEEAKTIFGLDHGGKSRAGILMFEVTNDPLLFPTWVTAIEARRYI